jgi:hypothetical protein
LNSPTKHILTWSCLNFLGWIILYIFELKSSQ